MVLKTLSEEGVIVSINRPKTVDVCKWFHLTAVLLRGGANG